MANEHIMKVAMMARKAGMSYGEYVASHGDLPSEKRMIHKTLPSVRTCQICGAPLGGKQQAYCSAECRGLAARIRAKELKKEKKGKGGQTV